MRVWVTSVPDVASVWPSARKRRVGKHEGLADGPQGEHRVVADLVGHVRGGLQRVRPVAEQQLVDDAAQQDQGRVEPQREDRADETQGARQTVRSPTASRLATMPANTDR